ncbi:MAG: S49 family peptidase [Leptospiraceae bacterium]|nr:S49 family peptidase [Leptospiraceae bacterium]
MLPFRVFQYLYYKIFRIFRRGDHLLFKIPDRFSSYKKTTLVELLSRKEEDETLIDFLYSLDKLSKCSELRKISFIIGRVEFGLSELYNIEMGIKQIKKNGIVTAGFCESGNLKSLYLLSLMDEKYGVENGEFMVLLPSVESFFFGNMLKNLGIQIESFASGSYKSFAEPFQRTAFSEEARENISQLIDSIQSQITTTFKGNSSITNEILQIPILSAEFLISCNFLNSLLDEEDFMENYCNKGYKKIDEKSEPEELYKKASLKSVYLWNKLQEFSFFPKRKQIIKILSLKGDILTGKKDDPEIKSGQILAYPLMNMLREIQKDKRVKGLILDLDTGGGSAYASELLHREILKLRKTVKIYSYFQNATASGGYYIATASEKMFSNPYCITGSIGSIMIRPDLKNFYQKIGLTKDRIGFYKFRDIFSEYGKLSPNSKKFLKDEISRVNDLFCKRVCDAKNIKIAKLKPLAEGRIFSGLTFHKKQMIDEISSLLETIQSLKQELNFEKVKIEVEQPIYSLRTFVKDFRVNIKGILSNYLPNYTENGLVQLKSPFFETLYRSIHNIETIL